jgi:hypothetical protein
MDVRLPDVGTAHPFTTTSRVELYSVRCLRERSFAEAVAK